MKLFIDTSSNERVVIGLGQERFEKRPDSKYDQILLPFIIETMKEKNTSFSEITSIEVATGPGSFTGLRVGVSVAQALGWSLGIPVNGKDIKNGEYIEIQYD